MDLFVKNVLYILNVIMGNKANKEVINPIHHVTIENKSVFMSQKLGYFTMGSAQSLQLLIDAYCLQLFKRCKLYIPYDIINIIWTYIFEINTNNATLISYKDRQFTYQYILKGNKRQTIDFHFTLTITKDDKSYSTVKQRISQNLKKSLQNLKKNTECSKFKKIIRHKMMILGAGLTGKSSILKQLRYIYGREFDEPEFVAAKPHITQNLIESIRTLAIYSDILYSQGKNTHVKPENIEIRNRVARMSDKQQFTREHYNDFVQLWNDIGIQRTFMKYRYEFQLLQNFPYLAANMHNYYLQSYIPTFEDLCKSRQRTSGINRLKFIDVNETGKYEEIYEIYDVGGLKAERRKWYHFLDDVEVIMFVVDLSGFCRLLWEDNRNNRLREDIGLFRHVIDLKNCKNSHVVVLLNKMDIFFEDIKYKNVKDYFKDFIGDSECLKDVIEFILNKILDQMRG
eukprot:78961_1